MILDPVRLAVAVITTFHCEQVEPREGGGSHRLYPQAEALGLGLSLKVRQSHPVLLTLGLTLSAASYCVRLAEMCRASSRDLTPNKKVNHFDSEQRTPN